MSFVFVFGQADNLPGYKYVDEGNLKELVEYTRTYVPPVAVEGTIQSTAPALFEDPRSSNKQRIVLLLVIK